MNSDAPRLSVSITFDFDAMSVWIGSHHSNNPAMISRGEYGAVVIPRILELLAKHDIRTTFFILRVRHLVEIGLQVFRGNGPRG